MALMLACVLASVSGSCFVGYVLDGFRPAPPCIPPPSGCQPASLLSQAGSFLSFLLLMAASVWLIYRRVRKGIEADG